MKKNKTESHETVLAIDPHVRGFGYIVFEGPDTPINWGISSIRCMKNAGTCKKVAKLIDDYQPDVLIVHNVTGSKRCERMQRLTSKLAALAIKQGIKTASLATKDVEVVFSQFGASTKYGIATAIAEWFPALAPKLPFKRKLWDAEDDRFAIFDAAALALTYYYLKQ